MQILSNVNPFFYTPYVGGVPLNLSIEHRNAITMKIQIALLDTGTVNKYLSNDGFWLEPSNTYIEFPAWDGKSDWSTFSKTIPPCFVSPFSTNFLNGYLNRAS